MKAASIPNKPRFSLMKQNDIQSFYHMQMPRWLFFDPKYMPLPLEAKVAYTFLLNRFQLSRLNGWVNDDGEVFIIYTRESLAAEMQISYRKVIESMKALAAANLIWERRCGRGEANQIYLAKVELTDENASAYESAPFVSAEHEAVASRPAESALLDSAKNPPGHDGGEQRSPINAVEATYQEVSASDVKTCKSGTSRPAASAGLELPVQQANNIELREIDKSDIKRPSVCFASAREPCERRTDGDRELKELDKILAGCHLWVFEPETEKVFENAIERLYFTEKYKIGGAVLPQRRVRSHLRCLDEARLRDAERKIAANTGQEVRNSTAYTMAVIFNSICEVESDLMSDPYLNRLKSRAPTQPDNGRWY